MDNKTTLISVTTDAFSRKGYDGVGVQEIVELAGVTKPTLYHYFGSKYGLLEAVLANGFQNLIPPLQRVAEYRHDLPKTLTEIFLIYIQFAADYPQFTRMILAMQFTPVDSEVFTAIQPYEDQQQKILTCMFEAAVFDHGNMRGRAHIYAVSYLGLISSCLGLWLKGKVSFAEEFIYRTVHQYMHGIYS